MSERKTPVQTYLVDYVCDSCKAGLMVPTGVALMSIPPQYPHVCNGCGVSQNLRKMYPALDHQRIGDPE